MTVSDEAQKIIIMTLKKHSPSPGSYTPGQIFAWLKEDYGDEVGWISKSKLGRVLTTLRCPKHYVGAEKRYFIYPTQLSEHSIVTLTMKAFEEEEEE